MNYEISPSCIRHVKPLARLLRPAACITLQSFGENVRRSLQQAYLSSSYSRTALVDGAPVAMWGIQGVLLMDYAIVWLAMSETITQRPLAVVRCAKRELETMSDRAGRLYARISKDDERARLFAETLGFRSSPQLPDPVPGLSLMMLGAF